MLNGLRLLNKRIEDVRLSVCGNPDFVVKISNVFGHKTLSPGDTTRVGWRAEDCRALDRT